VAFNGRSGVTAEFYLTSGEVLENIVDLERITRNKCALVKIVKGV
jgi:hypothetical protein